MWKRLNKGNLIRNADGNTRHKFILLALVLLVTSLSQLMGGGAALAQTKKEFCGPNVVVRDFWHGVPAIPREIRLVNSGRIGFAPAALKIYPPTPGEFLSLIGHGRMSLRGHVIDGQAPHNPALNWRVVSRLERISRAKRATTLKQRIIEIDRLVDFQGLQLGFHTKVQPGIYRVALEFVNSVGATLGERAAMFRAVYPQSKLRLTASKPTFDSSQLGRVRVENQGTVRVKSAYEYRLWRVGANGKEIVPVNPLNATNDRPVAEPGQTARCVPVQIPSTAPAGDYLIGVEVESPLLEKPRTLLVEVRVRDPAPA